MAFSDATVCELCANAGFSSVTAILVQAHTCAANPESSGSASFLPAVLYQTRLPVSGCKCKW